MSTELDVVSVGNAIVDVLSRTDDETLEGISDVHRRYRRLIDPHTAVGFVAAERYRSACGGQDPSVVVLSTAHPAKFPDTVRRATGRRPGVPDPLRRVMRLPKHSLQIGNSLEELRECLRRHL